MSIVRASDRPIAQSFATGMSHTGDTDETALATIAVPPMGPNDMLRIECLWQRNGSGASNVNGRIRLAQSNGTAFLNMALTTSQLSARTVTLIANRGVTNSQIGGDDIIQSVIGAAAGAPITDTEETNAGVPLYLNGVLTNGGDSITLEGYSIKLLRP